MGLSPFLLFIWTRLTTFIRLLMIMLIIVRFWFEHCQCDYLNKASLLSLTTQVIFWAVAEFSDFLTNQFPYLSVHLTNSTFEALKSVSKINQLSSSWAFLIFVLLIYRPPELAYKYGNLSDEVCKPGYAAAKMASIYHKWGLPFLLHLISDNWHIFN